MLTSTTDLSGQIDEMWANLINGRQPSDTDLQIVKQAINLLNGGSVRVAQRIDGVTEVQEWLKKALLLYFVTAPNSGTKAGALTYYDKVPLKANFAELGVRAVPGAIARWGSFIEPGVVLMPSFVNIGARVGSGTMVDTWATVGSCAQIGRNVHLSGGVGIGGVLEPPQAAPVIIGDDAFIGSRCMVTEGAVVGEGAMLGAGVILNPSIPVIDSMTGLEVSRGVVPPDCLVIQATRTKQFGATSFGLSCALIIKRFEEGERHDKAALNTFLRDNQVAM